jgi:hypothetical protein
MAGRHFRDWNIAIVEDSSCDRGSNNINEICSIDNTAVNQSQKQKELLLCQSVKIIILSVHS